MQYFYIKYISSTSCLTINVIIVMPMYAVVCELKLIGQKSSKPHYDRTALVVCVGNNYHYYVHEWIVQLCIVNQSNQLAHDK